MGEHTGYQDAMLFAVIHDRFGRRPLPVAARCCTRCGSLVADEDRHDVWHTALESRPS